MFGQYACRFTFRVTLEGNGDPGHSAAGLWALSKPVVTVHVNEPNQLRKCGPSTVGWLSAW